MVAGRGNLLQRQRVGDGDGEGTVGGRGEVGGALLGGGRKVVAAEQAKRDVGEEQRPERQLGAVAPAGVGGDHPSDGEQLHVQVGVIGQRTLDDAVDRIGACARIDSTTSGAPRSTACTTTDRSMRSRSAVRRAIPSCRHRSATRSVPAWGSRATAWSAGTTVYSAAVPDGR